MRTIVFAPPAAKEFDALDSQIRTQIEGDLIVLAGSHGRAALGIKPLQGVDALRLRSGDWRVIFREDKERVQVLAIRHRREAYR